MGNFSVNNNTNNVAYTQAKKPSKAKVVAGAAALTGIVVLGAGLATGKVKPGDIATFAQKAGAGVLDAVKHPKSIPNKLWGLTVDAISNGTAAIFKAKNAAAEGLQLVSGYAKAIGSAFADVFGKK